MTSYRFNGMAGLVPTIALIVAVQRCALAVPPLPVDERVVISLLPTASSSQMDVSIGEIARVDTSNAALKQLIESLDIAAAPQEGETTVISPKRIEFRLRLAGLDARDVSIRGQQSLVKGRRILTSKIQVRAVEAPAIRSTSHAEFTPPRSKPISAATPVEDQSLTVLETVEDTIAEVARKAVLAQLPWPEDDVTFQLAQPISKEARLIEPATITGCTAQLRGSGSPVGRVSVDVTVNANGQAPTVIPVALDVRHFENVVSTSHPIARGKKIQKEDLYVHRWDVTGATDYCTKPEQLIGRVANRVLPEAQIVRDSDLERSGNGQAAGPGSLVVVKQRDQVNMIVRAGGMTITTKGEAMQQGRVGETIQLQNMESKAPVRGKVISATEVEITP